MDRLIFWICMYVFYHLPLFIIAVKSEHPLAWLAWIPLGEIWLMCDMADLPLTWVLLFFIPYLGAVVFSVMAWGRISENTNKPFWLAYLMLFPVINMITVYYMAMRNT